MLYQLQRCSLFLLLAAGACADSSGTDNADNGVGETLGAMPSAEMETIPNGTAGSAQAAADPGTGGAGSGGGSSEAGAAGSLSSGGASEGGSAGEAPDNTAGGGSGGSQQPEAFNPCPADGEPCRVMPLGDSITDGAGSSHRAGYRPDLFRMALEDGRRLTFVGSTQNGPDTVDGQPFPKDNEGHSGWTIDDGGGRDGLYPEVEGWLTEHPPHIVLLMIGTNDVNIELELDTASDRLELLLDRIIENAPDALLVVAQIVPTTNDVKNQRVMAFNAPIESMLQERTAEGNHVLLVDMYEAFVSEPNYKDEFMNDELHPNDAGYLAMAETWYAAIGELLPE